MISVKKVCHQERICFRKDNAVTYHHHRSVRFGKNILSS
uniref:Uncharacterized protein n=1 Tax=Arundo donax TaxID=35708 RepID=A0A0A9BBJ1_ARUDO